MSALLLFLAGTNAPRTWRVVFSSRCCPGQVQKDVESLLGRETLHSLLYVFVYIVFEVVH